MLEWWTGWRSLEWWLIGESVGPRPVEAGAAPGPYRLTPGTPVGVILAADVRVILTAGVVLTVGVILTLSVRAQSGPGGHTLGGSAGGGDAVVLGPHSVGAGGGDAGLVGDVDIGEALSVSICVGVESEVKEEVSSEDCGSFTSLK